MQKNLNFRFFKDINCPLKHNVRFVRHLWRIKFAGRPTCKLSKDVCAHIKRVPYKAGMLPSNETSRRRKIRP